jgi:hypothetical protein
MAVEHSVCRSGSFVVERGWFSGACAAASWEAKRNRNVAISKPPFLTECNAWPPLD